MVLLHLWGPLAINAYGFFIAIAVYVYWHCVHADRRRAQLLAEDQLTTLLILGIVAAFFGGRILFILSHWYTLSSLHDFIYPWNGGFSILGSVSLVIGVAMTYVRWKKIPVLPTADLLVTHAPLMQAIARLGCMAAGCCAGTVINSHSFVGSYVIQYASLGHHPTQLYSVFLLSIVYLFLRTLSTYQIPIGTLFACYCIGIGFERFAVDFLRADRILVNGTVSFHQYVALGLMGIGTMLFVYTTTRRSHEYI